MEKGTKQKLIALVKACFNSQDPLKDIHHVLKSFLQAGHNKNEVIACLEEYMLTLRKEGKEREEDLVLDGLSFLVGWCAPDLQL